MTNPGGDVNTVVIEIEPGWICVTIGEPRPEPHRIEFFLRRTIEDWCDDHPGFVVDRSEAITNSGALLGVNVWYHDAVEPRDAECVDPGSDFDFEVHDRVEKQFSREYIEAVVDDALAILTAYEGRRDTFVVVNPRRLAVLLHGRARRIAVLPLDIVEQMLDGGMRTRLETWLASPSVRFYTFHIPGNWFDGSS